MVQHEGVNNVQNPIDISKTAQVCGEENKEILGQLVLRFQSKEFFHLQEILLIFQCVVGIVYAWLKNFVQENFLFQKVVWGPLISSQNV
jgi:hypothetical protein